MPRPNMARKGTSGISTVTGSKVGLIDSHSGEGILLIVVKDHLICRTVVSDTEHQE